MLSFRDSKSSLTVAITVSPLAHPAEALSPKEAFARRWRFGSFLEMFEASKPEGNAGGKKKWLVTPLRGGKWLLWNDANIDDAQVVDSRDDAIRKIGLS